MHPDVEQLERLRHGELPRANESAVRDHLAGCASCRERAADVAREEDDLHALLRRLDHQPPRVSADLVAARARARDRTLARWAAGILLTLTVGGVAYGAPGSPVRSWVRALAARSGPDRGHRLTPVPAPTDSAVAGIAVAPGADLVILFARAASGGTARVVVTLTDAADVVVRAPLGSASFTTDAERLVIEHQDPHASYEIGVPRAAPRVEIRAGGRTIFLKTGDRIAAVPDGAAEPFVLPLASPP